MLPVILLLLFLGSTLDDKGPVPSKEEQSKIRERLRILFQKEYTKSSPAELRNLAEKLHSGALEEKENSANRYVMLLEVISVAARGGDLDKAIVSAQEISQGYGVNNLQEILGGIIAETYGLKSQNSECVKLASLELANPSTSQAQVNVAKVWKELGSKISNDYRVVPFRRIRKLMLDVMVKEELKGLERTEAEQLCQIANGEIDKNDAKSSRFGLYEGKWAIKYANGWTHEYEIIADGSLKFVGVSNLEEGILDVNKIAKYDKNAKLTRHGGVVEVRFNRGKIIERFSLDGDNLRVERFDPATLYPNNPNNKGEGVRLK